MESPSSVDLSKVRIFRHTFLGIVRPRRLKLGTHVGSGQMYHVYRNQAAAAYSSLYYVPHRRGGGHIVFGADPVGVGVIVGIGVSDNVTLSCLHDIS